MTRVLVLSNADVQASLAPSDCERAMTAVLAAHARGEAYFPLRSVVVPPDAPGFIGLMPAYSGGLDGAPGAFALKALCLIPSNPQRGLDTHQGTVTLFDHETGRPTAILDASAVTEIRTAAVTTAATRVLAREDSRVLAILGAGVQGRSHLRALQDVRDWEEIRVFSPTQAHAEALTSGSPKARACATAREAVDGADVIVTATNSREPVLARDWLSAGAHVNAVGASMPSARELDVATVAAAALFCDSRESLRNEAGEFRLAIKEGAVAGEDHVRAEIGEVFAGIKAGRADETELTVFRSLGVGVEDLAAAQLAVATAEQRGLGTEVEL